MTKPTKLEQEWAARVLHVFVTDSQGRLARGSKLRQEMLDDLKNGRKLSGYRAQWIIASARRMLALANVIAGEFNDAYPADQASSMDLADVLYTAANMLKQAARDDSPSVEAPPESQA